MPTLRITGVANLARKLENLQNYFEEEIFNDSFGKVMKDAATEFTNRAPKDTGALKDSIEGVVEPKPYGADGIVRANVAYAPYVEFETRPHFVPAKYIGDWAVRHGFGFTGLIVSGKAQPFFRRNKNETLREVAERLQDMSKDEMVKQIIRRLKY